MQIFTGKILSIKKDKNFNNKVIAKVDIKPDPMYFFPSRNLSLKVGDTASLFKEENKMGYIKILITFVTDEQNTNGSNT